MAGDFQQVGTMRMGVPAAEEETIMFQAVMQDIQSMEEGFEWNGLVHPSQLHTVDFSSQNPLNKWDMEALRQANSLLSTTSF